MYRWLDDGLGRESPRTNVPVNCVLNLDGMLRSPAISFDLELPGTNEEIERQMKALVDTEDMMTRQIIYLLVLNKFYTPDYSQNAYRSSEFSAVASSANSIYMHRRVERIATEVDCTAFTYLKVFMDNLL